MKKNRLIFIAVAIVLLVGGVYYLAAAQKKSEARLKERVNRLWEAKLANEWGTVYDMTDESFRNKMKRDAYIKRANLVFTKFEVKEVELASSQEEASVHVDYSISQMGFDFSMNGKEKWVWEKDDWYLHINASSPFMDRRPPPKKTE